jgi:hypothetical protein
MKTPHRVLALAMVLAFPGFSQAATSDPTETVTKGAPTPMGTVRGEGRSAKVPVGLTVIPLAPIVVGNGTLRGQVEAVPPVPERGRSLERSPLTQPQCLICLGGNASAEWTGATGSFHVDRVENYRSSGVSGPLDLKMVLTVNQPIWGQTISAYAFSSTVSLNPLSAGYMYAPVDSGTISYLGSSMPSGEYFLLMFLRENVSGTWHYDDWIQMDKKVSCTGSGCTTVNPPPSCTEDAYTMCLAGGRYRATGRWKNQYAGGAQANLSKAKLTDLTGAFWIADANTYEFMIRITTSGTDNGRAWVSILTFTDVEFWVAVTDTVNGQYKEYHSNPGNRTLVFDPSFFVYP